MSPGVEGPPGLRRPWWERDPVKLWVPVAAVVAVTLQTVAYAGYQAFYGSFGVDADEVGFDYTSTLRRGSVPLAMSLIATLLVLSFGGLFLAWLVAAIRAGNRLDRSTELLLAHPGRARRTVALLAGWCLAILLLARLLSGWPWFVAGALALGGVLVADGAAVRGTDEPSTVSVLLESRQQGGGRHLFVLLVAAGVGAVGANLRITLVVVAVLFLVDRGLAPPQNVIPAAERFRRLPLFPVTSVLLIVIGFAAGGLVSSLDRALGIAHLDRKRARVVAGGELAFEPFSIFGLIQPQARRVTVTWLGEHPPPSFVDQQGKAVTRTLTFFGEHSGIAVLYDADQQRIIRLPTGSLEVTRPVPKPA